MRGIGPYTIDDFGRPMFPNRWRMTKNGKTYTWNEYERTFGSPAQARAAQTAALVSIAMADEIVASYTRSRKP